MHLRSSMKWLEPKILKKPYWVKWKLHHIHIDNKCKITHSILKEVTTEVMLKDQEYAMNCVKDLIQKLEQQNIHNIFEKKLDLLIRENIIDLVSI